jgi:hypothetical protein
MNSRVLMIAAAAAVGAASLASGSAAASTSAVAASLSGPVWGTAQEVPGTAALNQGGAAQLLSMSCAAAGACSAAGYYSDGSSHTQAFVVSQTGGTWHAAIKAPGTAADMNAMSCASAGNCSAGGYSFSSGEQAFVASQVNGTWHAGIEVPGTAALNQGGGAQVLSVSCASAGNCSAGGFYSLSSGDDEAFVASQVNDTWHTAIEVPGIAALNRGGAAFITSVSCASAGNCSAGGHYFDSSFRAQAFVINQVNGTWHTAIEVPGTAALNQNEHADVTSVSCAGAGSCSAGGFYTDSSVREQVFVVSQVNGTWHTAIEVPGTAALNRGGNAYLTAVSCGSAGNCSAGGDYTDRSGHGQVFVVSEK